MERHSFFYRILLPSVGAVLLFLVAMYVFVLPAYRENLMDKKRETIRELTTTAWSVMQRLDKSADHDFTTAQAQAEAREIIEGMRYGAEYKDYFWITDTLPRMIMHPWRPQLNGQDLSDFADPEGKRFFVEITRLAREHGEGYIDYKWQWKDDSMVVVPKLSYVKLYEPWGWIIGTGIYVEDVQREISAIVRTVVWISFFITIIIGLAIAYLARRSYLSGQLQKKAQQQQRETMERYKQLVEASSDGVLMTLNGEIVYCNPFLVDLMGFNPQETDETNEKLINSLNCFFQIKNQKNDVKASTETSEIIKEQKITRKNGQQTDVVITRSKFGMQGKNGYIYTVKDVSISKDVERELDLSMEKFKSIADMMNLGIFRCTMGRQSRFTEANKKALKLLGYASFKELQEIEVQDLFHERDEKKEVIRAISESLVIKDRLLHIRKSDGTIIPVLVSLFPVKDLHDRAVYYDGILLDAYEHLSRDAGFEKAPVQFSASVLLKPLKDFIQPAPVISRDTPVNVASRLMTMKNTDICLVSNDAGQIAGLLTHRDISRRVVAKDLEIAMPAWQVMSAPVISISDEEMVVDAFSLMMEHRITHVAVFNSNRKPYGYISLLALSELRRNTPEYIIHSIQKAQSIEEIMEHMRLVPSLVESLVETGVGSTTSGKLISRISDTVTERFIQSAIKELGPPPCPFAFLALGSEGRREQTLATDQDNALVFGTPGYQSQPSDYEYFLALGKQVCTNLDKVGYPFCEGGVMAMNRQWCVSFDEMQQQVASWIDTPNPGELLNTGIFFDFRYASGDFAVADNLQRFCLEQIRDKSVFLFNLVQNTISIKPKTGFLSKSAWSTADKKEDYFNCKEPLLAITSIARLWALKFGVTEKNTLERFLVLQNMNLLQASVTEEFSQAFKHLTHLRIRNQLHNISKGEKPSNLIHPSQLTDMDRIMLKKIFSAIANHQSRLATEFRIG